MSLDNESAITRWSLSSEKKIIENFTKFYQNFGRSREKWRPERLKKWNLDFLDDFPQNYVPGP